MQPDVLANGLQMPHVMERLEADYTLHKLFEASDKQGFLKEVGPRIRAIAAAGHSYGVPASLIDACPKLEIISSFGVGVDSLDVAHAKKRGVIVCNTPDVRNAEHTIQSIVREGPSPRKENAA